jgi:hypothetical protein
MKEIFKNPKIEGGFEDNWKQLQLIKIQTLKLKSLNLAKYENIFPDKKKQNNRMLDERMAAKEILVSSIVKTYLKRSLTK